MAQFSGSPFGTNAHCSAATEHSENGSRMDRANRARGSGILASMPLTPSQRITLMKEISERLGAESWPLIDTTLKQFSLPSSDVWNGPADAYVLTMLNGAKD